jgi:hypothetical protein
VRREELHAPREELHAPREELHAPREALRATADSVPAGPVRKFVCEAILSPGRGNGQIQACRTRTGD